jgi:hypothetical protein
MDKVSVGLSEEGKFVAMWKCPACNTNVCCNIQKPKESEKDSQFLKDMGIQVF